MHADQADSRGLNDSVDEKGIPAHLLKHKCPRLGTQDMHLPSTIFVHRIFCNVVDRAPAHLTNRIPPRRIFLVAEHDNVLWDDAQPLACFFLDFSDAALVGGD
jgi:hypothetical protein